MRGWLFAAVCIVTMVGIGVCVNLTTGCAGDGKRELWERCGLVFHSECLESDEFRACEYEYYKVCINE